MAEVDIDLTDKLIELLNIPAGDRDAGWMTEFTAVAPNAALAVAEKDVQKGPDGFSYLHLLIPPQDGEFKGFSISHLLDICIEKGIGAVICPDATSSPLWVFTYGNLLSYKLFRKFDARDPLAASSAAPPSGSRQLMASQPSEFFLPQATRQILKQYLALNGVAEPAMFLLHDTSKTPPQQLVFNLFRDDFPSDEHFQQVCVRVTWYLPPSYSFVTLANKQTEFQRNFAPL